MSSRYQIKAFLNQFPWLLNLLIEQQERYLSPALPDVPVRGAKNREAVYLKRLIEESGLDVGVKRVDATLLSANLSWSAYQGRDSCQTFLVDVAGKVLLETEASIEEELVRLDNPDEIAYVMVFNTNYHYEYGMRPSLTLYKPPRNFTFREWRRKLAGNAEVELYRQLEAIDAV